MKIKFKNIEDITIKQYREILPYIEEESFDSKLIIVSKLTELSIEELKKMKMVDVNEVYKTALSILSKDYGYEFSQMKIDNKRYYFYKELDKMDTGMFTDLYSYTKTNEDIIKNLHIITAILIRDTRKYNSETVLARAELFNEKMSITDALSVAFFFLNLKITSLRSTKESLVKQLNQIKK